MVQRHVPTPDVRTLREMADAEGVDVSLIEDALLKTPEERLRDNSRVLATIDALRHALEKQHA